MLTLNPNARSSTSVPPTRRVSWAPSPSSVQTEPSSIRTTSSAIGGSTLTAQKPRASTPWTTRSLLNVKNWPLQQLLTACPPTQLLLLPKLLKLLVKLLLNLLVKLPLNLLEKQLLRNPWQTMRNKGLVVQGNSDQGSILVSDFKI